MFKKILLVLSFVILTSCNNKPTKGIKYGEDFFVFEPEITTSDLGLWKKRTPKNNSYFKDDGIEAIHQNYLEFTGNDKNSGEPTSPLSYTFKAPKSGNFRVVARMYQPLLKDEKNDKRNDIYIKLKGNFSSACQFSTQDLKQYQKFFGRGVRKWGSLYHMEGHINHEKVLAPVIYHLEEGNKYTFTIAGRSQGCSIDYILFFDETLDLTASSEDLATTTLIKHRP